MNPNALAEHSVVAIKPRSGALKENPGRASCYSMIFRDFGMAFDSAPSLYFVHKGAVGRMIRYI
jgi:hypothetical protein